MGEGHNWLQGGRNGVTHPPFGRGEFLALAQPASFDLQSGPPVPTMGHSRPGPTQEACFIGPDALTSVATARLLIWDDRFDDNPQARRPQSKHRPTL